MSALRYTPARPRNSLISKYQVLSSLSAKAPSAYFIRSLSPLDVDVARSCHMPAHHLGRPCRLSSQLADDVALEHLSSTVAGMVSWRYSGPFCITSQCCPVYFAINRFELELGFACRASLACTSAAGHPLRTANVYLYLARGLWLSYATQELNTTLSEFAALNSAINARTVDAKLVLAYTALEGRVSCGYHQQMSTKNSYERTLRGAANTS